MSQSEVMSPEFKIDSKCLYKVKQRKLFKKRFFDTCITGISIIFPWVSQSMRVGYTATSLRYMYVLNTE